MLGFEDGYEVAKLMAERFDIVRLREAAKILEGVSRAHVGEGREFLMGLAEGLSEITKFREELLRLQNMAKAMGIVLEVNVKFREA
ncbi:MAG: hypothetical protein QXT74_01790 [Candidatus Nezhaarchaeales archaeon]